MCLWSNGIIMGLDCKEESEQYLHRWSLFSISLQSSVCCTVQVAMGHVTHQVPSSKCELQGCICGLHCHFFFQTTHCYYLMTFLSEMSENGSSSKKRRTLSSEKMWSQQITGSLFWQPLILHRMDYLIIVLALKSFKYPAGDASRAQHSRFL